MLRRRGIVCLGLGLCLRFRRVVSGFGFDLWLRLRPIVTRTDRRCFDLVPVPRCVLGELVLGVGILLRLELGELADDLLERLVHRLQCFLGAPVGNLGTGAHRLQAFLERPQLRRGAAGTGFGAALLEAAGKLRHRLLDGGKVVEALLRRGDALAECGDLELRSLIAFADLAPELGFELLQPAVEIGHRIAGAG